jgi:hypothetical protein
MRLEGLIFLIVGVILCVVGLLYTTDLALVAIWMGGSIMIIVSIAIMFPQNKGVSIE